MASFEPSPRVVKPRSRKHKVLPIVVINRDEVLTEDGETLLLDELVARLPNMPPTLFVAFGAADLLAYLDNIFAMSHPTAWQRRVSEHQRYSYKMHPNPKARRSYRVHVIVHYFGWKNGNYHKLIDPITMYCHTFDTIYPLTPDKRARGTLPRLLEWSIILRNFCANNNLEVRPTIGAIASQFMTDPRFYPKARRKVPAKTNEVVREYLPGNHYILNVPPGNREYRAYYIDQRRAHHYHARTLTFPHADHLYAYGYFRNLTKYYRDSTSPDFHGLYCLDLLAPPSGIHYSWVEKNKNRTLERQFVFTNELPHLFDMGYTVKGVRAAWGSHIVDTGLNAYAQWACDTLDEYSDPKWLKMLLLAAYGTLASRPTYGESIFRLAKKGEPVTVLTGRRSMKGKLVKRTMKLEPGIVNVLQRGMIEAATRSESVGLVQWMESRNQRVLSIYADAVIVEVNDDRPLPPLPEPWEVKRELNHLQFYSRQAFASDGMTKLPGVGRRSTSLRGKAPRPVSVAELMEQEENANRLLTQVS